MSRLKSVVSSASAVVALSALSSAATCARSPRPWVPGATRQAQPPKEFDLRASANDYNGFMATPSWASQTQTDFPPKADACKKKPFDSACTTQNPTLDVARFPNSVICAFEFGSQIKGHANWAVASSVGEVLWLNLATDGDYNFMFFPDGNAGITGNNASSTGLATDSSASGGVARRFIELEFDSRETVSHFGTDWWMKFHDIVRGGRAAEIQTALNPDGPQAARASVTGLIGLDCEHDCHSEFHPLYAVAIEVNSSVTKNQWAVFVRNSGNEGFCSSLDHHVQLPERKLRLTLPKRGTRPRVVTAATEFASSAGEIAFPEVAFDKGTTDDGQVVLTFALPDPDKRASGDMLLTLEWPRAAVVAPRMRYPEGGATPRPAAPEEAGPKSAEQYLNDVVSARGIKSSEPAQLAAARGTPRNVLVPPPAVVPVVDFQRPTIQPIPARGRLAVAAAKEARDRELVKEICRATNGQPPPFNGQDTSRMCK